MNFHWGMTFKADVPNGGPHLHIVLNNTIGGKNLVVNISSFSPGCDDTCILEPGCGHEFVCNRSYVRYVDASAMHQADLAKLVNRRGTTKMADMPLLQVQRMRDGFLVRKKASQAVYKYFDSYCLPYPIETLGS